MKRQNHQEDVLDILVSEEEIKRKVKELGKIIHDDYKDKNLLLISILKGSIVFMADLLREINLRSTIDFMSVSSYANGTQSSGVVKIIKDLDHSIEGK
ncbi:MAG: phosphoribosyltransferase family protein, partial [Oscillospiraceae bacterium]